MSGPYNVRNLLRKGTTSIPIAKFLCPSQTTILKALHLHVSKVVGSSNYQSFPCPVSFRMAFRDAEAFMIDMITARLPEMTYNVPTHASVT